MILMRRFTQSRILNRVWTSDATFILPWNNKFISGLQKKHFFLIVEQLLTLEPRGLMSDNFCNLTKPNLTSEPTSLSTEVRKQAAFKLSSAALFILCAGAFITSRVVQISATRKSYSRRDCTKIWTVMSVLITDVSQVSMTAFHLAFEWGRPVFRCSCTTLCMTF